MTFEIGLLLAIIIITTLCFAFDWVSAAVALGVVLTLALNPVTTRAVGHGNLDRCARIPAQKFIALE